MSAFTPLSPAPSPERDSPSSAERTATPDVALNAPWLWDIFCQVIDNHGDLGVCWRLAADLAARGQRVRLWIDAPEALAWMAPHIPANIRCIHWCHPPSVQGARDWPSGAPVSAVPPADVVIEGFGCRIDAEHMARTPPVPLAQRPRRWINLEYLSAEDYVERSHGLPSPVMSGPAAGQTKFFFFPGLSAATGGLLREPDLPARQQRFRVGDWLAQHGIPAGAPDSRRLSLFCYEPATLPALLYRLANGTTPTQLLLTPGRAAAAVQAVLQQQPGLSAPGSALSIHPLPHLSQLDFDRLLWSCDFNCVRGEDSLVRAIWAGQPFVWQIYPQHDGAHWAKLDAFFDHWLDGAAPALAASVRRWQHWWNADAGSTLAASAAPKLSAADWAAWQAWALQARARLARLPDLVSSLIRFIGQTG